MDPFESIYKHFSTASKERIEAHEDTPLVLTPAQRERLRKLLIDELGGPVSARVVLERIEREV